MATFSPTDGVNEREPTLITDGALQDCSGAEYRVGEIGLFVARGRDLWGDVGGVTGRGLYEAGFDGNSQYVIAHEGNSLYYARIDADGLTFSLMDNLTEGSSELVGTHYANRHYLATSVANRRVELTTSGLSSFPIGMSGSSFAVGVSITQGAGSMTAVTGLEYWVTEYDSSRGIESVTGYTANTGVFTSLDSVVVTVTGVSMNPEADYIRWYRSTDGGTYPDGGLIRSTAIGTTQITDALVNTGELLVPYYGLVSIGGLDTDRDEEPPVLSLIFGPYMDSLLGVEVDEPRVLRFTPAGYPDSWPSTYALPLETHRRDEIVTGVVMPGRIGIFCNDSVHVVYRLPRDSDSIFAAGEMSEVHTDARGCVSRRGATVFTPPGTTGLVAWVARDGIWASNLSDSPVPLTDKIDWAGRVDVSKLTGCRLLDDPVNRRLIFIHRTADNTSYNTGIWYLDYQQFQNKGVRITFGDHGPLADAITVAYTDGSRRVVSIDSRSGNGQVYVEATQDADDSELTDSSGSVSFMMQTKEFLPGGPRARTQLENCTIMHDAGPSKIEHYFYHDRRDSYPDIKPMPDPDERTASTVVLGKAVNSYSIKIQSVGTTSYGVHWIDVEGYDVNNLGPSGGA